MLNLRKKHNLNKIIIKNIEKDLSKKFLVTPDKTITNNDFYFLMKKYKTIFENLGIRRGDRVALISEKRYEQIVVFYSLWALGAVVVPVNESLGKEETSFIINDAAPRLVVTSEKFEISTKKIFKEIITFEEIEEQEDFAIQGYIKPISTINLNPDEVACLVYTSGSTGNPKGVMLTHDNLIVNAATAARSISIDSSYSFYSLLPYWHAFALTVEVIMPAITHSTVYFAKGQRDFVSNIKTFNPSIILVVPRILEVIRTNILKKLKDKKLASNLFSYAHSIKEKKS